VVTGCFHWIVIASELISSWAKAGWTEKPKEFKALTSPSSGQGSGAIELDLRRGGIAPSEK
jgi:hypothetical protein